MTAPVRIDSTRSSATWQGRPGNFDRLNTRAIFPGDNEWGIPDLPVADFVPDGLIPFTFREVPNSDVAIHCFLDDYRFETAWSRPGQLLDRVAKVGVALSPDFSLWTEMPTAMQVWQVYRNRWCGAWWTFHGIEVIPTISWSTPDSFRYAFTGVQRGSVVAVSTVGLIRRKDLWPAFFAGYDAMVEAIKPPTVLCYGRLLPGMAGDIRVYRTRWDGR